MPHDSPINSSNFVNIAVRHGAQFFKTLGCFTITQRRPGRAGHSLPRSFAGRERLLAERAEVEISLLGYTRDEREMEPNK
jgi:hypothetical protein